MNPSEDEILEQSFQQAAKKARASLAPGKDVLKRTLSRFHQQSVTFPEAERHSYQEAKISLMDTILMNFRTYAPRYAAALVAIIAVVGIVRSYSHNPSDAPVTVSQTPTDSSVKGPVSTNKDGSPETRNPTKNDSIDVLLADIGQESDPSFDSEDAVAEESDSTSDELIISLSETYDEETF